MKHNRFLIWFATSTRASGGTGRLVNLVILSDGTPHGIVSLVLRRLSVKVARERRLGSIGVRGEVIRCG